MPGSPKDGYYSDLRGFVVRHHSRPDQSMGRVRRRPELNVVTMTQIGLGAWQLSENDARWKPTIAEVANWLARRMDSHGLLAYEFAMPHTYRLAPPWHSAMAQGQAASLLVRAAETLEEPSFIDAARLACLPLLDPDSILVVRTAEGPVLQEYPTTPPAHVLNGWIFGLFGLFDVASASGPVPSGGGSPDVGSLAAAAFSDGVQALASRLPRYELPGGWSRYDLYPHPRVNVATPFYHHLHRQQLKALARLRPHEVFTEMAQAWDRAARRPATVAGALVAKVRFRRAVPRRWRV